MKVNSNKKSLILCIVCGLICAVFVFLYTVSVRDSAEDSRIEAMAKYGGEQVEVCVAKRDIAVGEKIDFSCIEQKLWLADLLPNDAVRSSNDIIGKQCSSLIVSGEVVSNKHFQDTAISLEVPAGLSAVSVPAKDISAVGGAICAGMYVDVYATGNTSTTLIAQNLLVLSTSTTVSNSSSSSSVSWITLAVEPSHVQELVAASQATVLYFVLPSTDSVNDEESKNSNKKPDDISSSPGASNNNNKEE